MTEADSLLSPEELARIQEAERPKNLAELKPGDEVMIVRSSSGANRLSVERVKRTNRLHIFTTDERRYRINGGRLAGESGFYFTRLEIPTAKLRAEQAEQMARRDAIGTLASRRWDQWSTEELVAMVTAVRAVAAKNTEQAK